MAKCYNDIKLIGERVKEVLEKRGKTQVDLAKTLQTTPRNVSRYLNQGKINKSALIKIGEFLDCNPYYLCDEKISFDRFGTYARYNYDIDYCLKGLVYDREYEPTDFSEGEWNELKNIVAKIIDDYCAEHWKASI